MPLPAVLTPARRMEETAAATIAGETMIDLMNVLFLLGIKVQVSYLFGRWKGKGSADVFCVICLQVTRA